MARQAVATFDTVVVVGGDGTIHEVAQGLLLSKTRLAVVPAGSGNDFAKCLNLPAGVDDAVELILQGRSQLTDAGRIDERPFVNGVGIGFDGAVNAEARRMKRLTGFAAYFVAMLRTLPRFSPIEMVIEVDGEVFRERAYLTAVGNGAVCGGGFRLTPRARTDDGLLDVTVIGPMSLPALLWHLPKAFTGTIEKAPLVSTRRGGRIVVESPSPLPVHADGEVYSTDKTRHVIEVVPRALDVIGGF